MSAVTSSRGLFAVLVAVGVQACTPNPGPGFGSNEPLIPTNPEPTPVRNSTPPPPENKSDAAPTLPPAPPGTDPERAKIAASICAAAYSGSDVGCRSHPPFLKKEQQPDGRIIQHQGDPLLFCAIDGVFKGSFSRAGATQAVVSFAQCKESEDAMWDMGFPGSAVLVEEVDGRWKAIGYEPDVNLGSCLQDRRADGRDVLLCRSGLAAPPSGEVDYVFLLDFARAPNGKKNAVSLAKAFGDTLMCMNTEQGLQGGLISLSVMDMTLKNLNADGTDDLVVKIRRARAAPSPKLDAKVRAACKKTPGMIDALSFLPAPKETQLEFLSDADGFKAAPASQKILDAWKAESPEGFNGLYGVGPPMAGE